MITRVIGDVMSGIDPLARAGMDFDYWEDSLLTSSKSADLNALAANLMRRKDEVKRRRSWLLRYEGNAPRHCYQCRHYGVMQTCGVEISGLCSEKEEWAFTRTYGMRHICHLGLTR